MHGAWGQMPIDKAGNSMQRDELLAMICISARLEKPAFFAWPRAEKHIEGNASKLVATVTLL